MKKPLPLHLPDMGLDTSQPCWRSRGYLPHCDKLTLVQHITFRLFDSVPDHVVAAWKEELNIIPDLPANDQRLAELRKRLDKYEDAGHGECWLRRPGIAEVVQNNLLHFDDVKYKLMEWCVMPNHVHVLVLPMNGFTLDKIAHSWKSYTAHEANKILGRTGTFWFVEYRDRFIRDEKHLGDARNYIRFNPVNAGLAQTPEAWKYGSAFPGSADGSPAQCPGSAGGSPA